MKAWKWWWALGVVLWTWTSPDGTVWFTDDPDRIPPRYAEQAKEIETEPLQEYERYTHVEDPPDVAEEE